MTIADDRDGLAPTTIDGHARPDPARPRAPRRVAGCRVPMPHTEGMGIIRRVEQGLEGAVNGVFARAFKADVQPVEIAAALQRELDGSARIVSRDRRLVPNDFVIDLSPHDHDKLAPFTAALVKELSGSTREYADMQGYVFPGPLHLGLDRDDKLSTGRFAIRSAVVPDTSDHEAAGAWASGAAPSAQPGYDERYAGPVGSAAVSMVPGFGGGERSPAARSGRADNAPAAPAARWSESAVEDSRVGDGGSDGGGATAVGQWNIDADDWSDDPDGPVPFAHLQILGGDRIGVEPPGVVIGRSSDADIRVDDPGVSRHHAELRIQWTGTHYTLELVDLGSTNGSVVDGRRVSTAPVRDGSRITVGGTTLQLELDESRLTTG